MTPAWRSLLAERVSTLKNFPTDFFMALPDLNRSVRFTGLPFQGDLPRLRRREESLHRPQLPSEFRGGEGDSSPVRMNPHLHEALHRNAELFRDAALDGDPPESSVFREEQEAAIRAPGKRLVEHRYVGDLEKLAGLAG